MTDVTDRIAGAEKLIAVFGRWPTFHDAEVVRLGLDRRSPTGECEPTIDAVVHTWEMTNKIDAAGHYGMRNHVLVHLRFFGIDELQLNGFNGQNALFALTASAVEGREADGLHCQINFNPSFGVGMLFLCRAIEVVAVTPCNKDGIL
jgi:hypothetical protein